MATIALRPGALDRVQALAGIKNDEDFARAVGVSPATMHRAKSGKGDSVRLIAGIAKVFGYGIGEIAVAVSDPVAEAAEMEDAAA